MESSSSVRFSLRHQVGKGRMFTLSVPETDSTLPGGWDQVSLHVKVEPENRTANAFSLSQHYMPHRDDTNEIAVPCKDNTWTFHLGLTKNAKSTFKTKKYARAAPSPHTLSCDLMLSERLISSFQLKSLYAAGHKHETGKKQKEFYASQNSVLEIEISASGTRTSIIDCPPR